MSSVQFGGPLGVFVDPPSRASVKTRCMGAMTLGLEPQDELKNAARACVLKQVRAQIERALGAGTSLLGMDELPGFAPSIASAASAELRTPVEITMLKFGFSAEDADAMANAAIAGAHRPQAVAAPFCPRCGAAASGKFCASCGAPLAVSR